MSAIRRRVRFAQAARSKYGSEIEATALVGVAPQRVMWSGDLVMEQPTCMAVCGLIDTPASINDVLALG